MLAFEGSAPAAAGHMPQVADDEGGPAALSDYTNFLANNKAYRLLITGEVRNALQFSMASGMATSQWVSCAAAAAGNAAGSCPSCCSCVALVRKNPAVGLVRGHNNHRLPVSDDFLCLLVRVCCCCCCDVGGRNPTVPSSSSSYYKHVVAQAAR